MPNIPILINANAGLLNRQLTPEQLRDLVARMEVPGEVVETTSRQDMCDAVARFQQQGADRIGIAGGDGTVHAAVQCLACTDVALSILPLGTRNNFAHALGLPMEPEAALRVLHEGQVIGVDIGRARCGAASEFFTEAAGVGVFAEILEAYGPANKNFLRGIYAIARAITTLRARRLRLTLDGERVTERAVMCTIANGYRIGLGAAIAPGASVTDGELDVVILGDVTRVELIRYYRAVKANRQHEMPKCSRMRAHSVRIESARPMPLHVDDQVLGTTPADVSVAPRSLKVVVKQA